MSYTPAHPKGMINKRRVERALIPATEQLTFELTNNRQVLCNARSHRNGLIETPYIPKDSERAARLLAAIEMINHDRANAAAA